MSRRPDPRKKSLAELFAEENAEIKRRGIEEDMAYAEAEKAIQVLVPIVDLHDVLERLAKAEARLAEIEQTAVQDD